MNNYISLNNLLNLQFINSQIIFCIINDKFIEKNNFNRIPYAVVRKLLYSMETKQFICANSKNIKPYIITINGYVYNPNLDISILGLNSISSIKEIINLTKIMNIKIDILIKLQDDVFINYNNFSKNINEHIKIL